MKTIFEMDEKVKKEVWRKIKNYPYKISNFGRVKRIKSANGTRIGKILKLLIHSHGYLYVRLYKKEKKGKDFRIHRLVAESFLGPCPDGKEVNHKDGNKKHNKVSNLEYTTHSENIKHAFELGLKNHKGENHPSNKLREKDVLKIRKLYRTGNYIQEEIAKMFNISRSLISHIVSRKNWKHIK